MDCGLKEPEGQQGCMHADEAPVQQLRGGQPVRLLPLLERQLRLPEAYLVGHHPRHNRALPKACERSRDRVGSLAGVCNTGRLFGEDLPASSYPDRLAAMLIFHARLWQLASMLEPQNIIGDMQRNGTGAEIHACMQSWERAYHASIRSHHRSTR